MGRQHANPRAAGQRRSSSKMAFLVALFIAAIFAAPVCFIANDLSAKIVKQRRLLLEAKASALESAEKFRNLKNTQTTEKSKVTMLRDRARVIVKEIFSIQGKQNSMGKDLIDATTGAGRAPP